MCWTHSGPQILLPASLIKYRSCSRDEHPERLNCPLLQRGQKRLRWPGTGQTHALLCQGVRPYLRSVDVVCPPCPISNSRCNPDDMLRAEVTNSEGGIVPKVRSPASSPALSHFPTDGLRLWESGWFTQLPVCNVSITVCTHVICCLAYCQLKGARIRFLWKWTVGRLSDWCKRSRLFLEPRGTFLSYFNQVNGNGFPTLYKNFFLILFCDHLIIIL